MTEAIQRSAAARLSHFADTNAYVAGDAPTPCTPTRIVDGPPSSIQRYCRRNAAVLPLRIPMTPASTPSSSSRPRRRVAHSVVGTLIGAGVLAGTFALGSRYGANRIRERDAWADGKLLSTAIDSVRANALDSLPSEELIRRAVSGMLRELHDPYAALLREDGYRSYRGTLLGEGQGLGMSLRVQGPLLTVRAVADGSPAALAGVRRGDRVLSWNGVPIDEWRHRAATDTSHAVPETTTLMLRRAPSGDSARVLLRRATWHMPAIANAGMLTDSVGYVRVSSITQNVSTELEQSVDGLLRHGARALVLDLRGNGGGLFEEGVNAAALFLPPNAVVASLAGRGGAAPQVYRAKHSRWPALPLTVLVDAGTASAAEVIAAALRDHGRALLVGTPTYGKGVVQRVVRLSDDLSLRLTTARWLMPSGQSLQRRQGTPHDGSGGLAPDVLLDDPFLRDAGALPREWSPSAAALVVQTTDSVAARAFREGWQNLPMSSLESQLREVLATQVSRNMPRSAAAPWLSAATRLAMVRVFEMRDDGESLLRYSVREDAAMRAGLDVVSPGWDAVLADASSSAAAVPVATMPLSAESVRSRRP